MPVLTWQWAQRQRAVGFALIGAGATAVAVGWVSVSGASTPQEQLSYLVSAGLSGLLCLGIGLTLLLDAGLRDAARMVAELADVSPLSACPPQTENGFAGGGIVPIVVAGGVAAVLVGLGWNQAAGAPDEGSAVPGLTIGLAGLLVGAVAAAARLLALRATVARHRAAVVGPLAARYRPAPVTVDLAAGPATVTSSAASDPATVIVASGLTRFHRAGCPTLHDVDTTVVSRNDLAADLRPCQICEAGDR